MLHTGSNIGDVLSSCVNQTKMYIPKKSELDPKLLIIGYKQFRFGSDSRISDIRI